ncbi:MAG: hypothetical protein O3C40_17665 [Planctomycetota bacterium]|nr:hypothetical protein [Planctomycetota bacterium]
MRDAQRGEEGVGALLAFPTVDAARDQRVSDALNGRQPWQQGEVLEYEPNSAANACQFRIRTRTEVAFFEQHLAFRRAIQRPDQRQKRRFAGA